MRGRLERMFATLTPTAARQDQALSSLGTSVAGARRASCDVDSIGPLLRAADVLIATAIGVLGRGGFACGSGLPAESVLKLEGRRTTGDARVLVEIASLGASMPMALALFTEGVISFAQIRSIAVAVRSLGIAARAEVDEIVSSSADRCTDPDDLIARVDAACARLRPDLPLAREDRAISRSFLSIQGKLNGSAAIYGEADAASTATLCEAIDQASARPVASGDDAVSRASQRFDGLLAICEGFLAGIGAGGGAARTRPRPRLLAAVSAQHLATDGARVLWGLAGRPPAITPLSTEVLLCDAEIIPVVFDGARPVGVGNASRTIPDKLRTAIAARDGRCRFPGCRAPVAWTDVHHIVPVSRGGPTTEDNCLLLCRRCHRTVHRYQWKITTRRDGVIDFRHRGRTFASRPLSHLRA